MTKRKNNHLPHTTSHLSVVIPAALNVLQQAQRASDSNNLFEIDFSQVTRLKSNVANGDASDPVVYAGAAELAMRKLVAHFGFDRLPLTWGELNGFLDYCQAMHRFSGVGIPTASLLLWKACAREVEQEYYAWRLVAFDAYAAGEISRLLEIHVQQETLKRLARSFREYDEGELN
ncbi:hypothetical protein [Janthinobacterium sp. MDB2-8]|uniref:hypothetical protein n=1 Tax=Janthinobacterium sp. MDB2-8 TaxID=1259338 RepID=UPI003F227569